jgi:sterol desaturase/sphingolipid hydroxylase (fatty acid hydroxylase superfamily)
MDLKLTDKTELYGALLAITLGMVSYFLHKAVKTHTRMSFKETLNNFTIFLVWKFGFFSAGVALQFFIFSKIANLVPWKIQMTPAIFILSVVVMDFFYYWKHRYEHEWNILWAQHNVHHSSGEFNFSTSLRLPWVGSFLNWMFFIPALFMGFSAMQVILAHKVILTYQFFIHTEMVKSLGPLESTINSPSNHRVHHGSNPQYLDKNYGGILIIWDKIFGTYEKEVEPVKYGLVHPLNTTNSFFVNLNPWKDLLKKINLQKGISNKISTLFRSPG